MTKYGDATSTPSLRSIAKGLCSCLLYYTGILGCLSYIRRALFGGRVLVVAYHNISDRFPKFIGLSIGVDLFEKQIEYFKRKYDIVTLDRVVELLRDGVKPRKDTIAITFDDNFREFYDVVTPIIEKSAIPVTIFVATGPLDTGKGLFVDAIVVAVAETKEKQLELSEHAMGIVAIDSLEAKQDAIVKINDYAKKMSMQDADALRSEILVKLGFGYEMSRNPKLTWANVREMKGKGVAFGAHTIAHPHLGRVSIEDARREILGSKHALERELREEIHYFAYPFGTEDSYNEEVMGEVERAGFQAAFTLDVRAEGKRRGAFNIPRTNMTVGGSCLFGETFFRPLFALEMSGLADYLFFRRGN